jgi:hypothetical protein
MIFVSVLSGEWLVGAGAFFIGETDILSGRKAFEVSMVDCFFLRLCLNADLTIWPTIWRDGSGSQLSEPYTTNLVHPEKTTASYFGGY